MYNYNQTIVDNTETSRVITMLGLESSLFHFLIIRDQLSHILVSRYIMLSTWIKVHFLIVMILVKGLQAYSGADNSQCSCYTFDGIPRSWLYGRQQCRRQGGELVSMETVEEWKFIKTQIQNRRTEPRGLNEWSIGLEKRDGRWKWLSNHSLEYDKWQPGEPSRRQDEKCVVIAKNYPSDTYGLFGDASCKDVWRGWICEYKIKADCSNNQVKWCKNPVTPTVMTVPKTDPEVITTTATTTKATTTSGRKTAASDFAISTTARQPTTKKTTTDRKLNVPTPSTTTTTNKDQTAASEYPTPTTTPYKKYTEMSTTTTETDDVTTRAVSRTTKKPLPILTIIIPVLVVGVVVFLCCVVLCVCGWKLKRKGKPETRLKHDGTNTDHNTSDVMVGSSSGLHVNEHELKAIAIHPNNACAQDNSHATHGNPLDNSTDTKEDTESSRGCQVSQMTHDALEVRNHSNMTSLESTGKESNQNKAKNDSSNPTGKSPQEHMDLTPDDTVGKENTAKVSDIYATVDKSKKKNKTTEVVYAEVKRRSKNPEDQHEDFVTYAELDDFNHDVTRSVSKAPPPYKPKESVSTDTNQMSNQVNQPHHHPTNPQNMLVSRPFKFAV